MSLEGIQDSGAQWLRMYAGLTIAGLGGFCASAYFLSRAFVYPFFFLVAMLAALPPLAREYLSEDSPALLDFGRDFMGLGTATAVGSMVYIYLSIVLLNKAFYGG